VQLFHHELNNVTNSTSSTGIASKKIVKVPYDIKIINSEDQEIDKKRFIKLIRILWSKSNEIIRTQRLIRIVSTKNIFYVYLSDKVFVVKRDDGEFSAKSKDYFVEYLDGSSATGVKKCIRFIGGGEIIFK